MKFLAALLFLSVFTVSARAEVKCEANINGYKIHNVYVIGDQYNGVVWAYKHLSEQTCLTPVTDPSKADAILEIYSDSPTHPGAVDDGSAGESSLSVSCTSGAESTNCVDSSGNMMTVDCSGGVCSSYYGPNPLLGVIKLLTLWANPLNVWYQADARIYTKDKKLLWRSVDQKGHDLWPDKVREGTNSPLCEPHATFSPMHNKYKNYRYWGMKKCGIVFAPSVSIDLKVRAKQKAKQDIAQQKEDEKEQMIQNAKDAALEQKQ